VIKVAIIRWRDPAGLTHRGFWPGLWADEDLWTEDREGMTVYETETAVVAEANVPGVPADRVDVSFEDGVLTIKAEHQETEEQKKKKKTVYRQAREARYLYSTSVPCPVKADKIDAEVKEGVVKVTMPKAEGSKPKKIKVRAAAK
jgi:HSP20 family protein